MIFQSAWLSWVLRILRLILKNPILSFQRQMNQYYQYSIHRTMTGILTKVKAVAASTQLLLWPRLPTLLSSTLSTWATLTGMLCPSRPLHLHTRPSQAQKGRKPQVVPKKQTPAALLSCATRNVLSGRGCSSETWLSLQTRKKDAMIPNNWKITIPLLPQT